MANALYPKWKETLLQNDANSALNSAEGTTGLFAALIDTSVYTYNSAHQFYSDLSGILGTDQEILTKTQVNGILDGSNITFPSVTAGSGVTANAIVLYRKNAGANTTWKLVAYLDTGFTGLPVTPNGGDIIVTWDAAGIFAL